jgi:hypothetical protein
MKTQINLHNRQKAIEKIKRMGCKDITSEMHPNKVGKYYFRLDLFDGKYISFNINYPGYEEMFVTFWAEYPKGQNESYESHLIRFDEFIKEDNSIPMETKKIYL